MNLQPIAVSISGPGWLEEVRFANHLLRRNTRVLWAQEPLNHNDSIAPGSLIVPLDPSFDAGLETIEPLEPIQQRAERSGIELVPLADEATFIALPLKPIRIGLYGGGGAPFNHAGVFGEAGFQLRFLNDAQIRAGELNTVHAFVMPGGGARAMYGQLEPLGTEGTEKLNQWVRNGGMYIGSCAGAYDCAIASPQFNASCPPKEALQLVNAQVWNGDGNGLGGEIDGLDSPGVGVIRLKNTSQHHPVMFGMPEEFDVVHYNGPVFHTLETQEIEGASLAEGLAAFNGAGDRFTAAEDFMGGNSDPASTLVSRASAAGKFAAVAGELGIGRVVAFGSHPEFGFNLAMDEWADPTRMLVNAALWQASSSDLQPAPWSYRDASGPISAPRGASLGQVRTLAQQLLKDIESLRQYSIEPLPRWLSNDYAMSVFGLTPGVIWQQSLQDIEQLASSIDDQAARLAGRLGSLGSSEDEREFLYQLDCLILDERKASWLQDGGFQGVTRLLKTAHDMCSKAVENWSVELGPPAGPYDYFDENPYHLVAGSYLAAVGCVAGASQLMRVLEAEIEVAVHHPVSQGMAV